MSLPPNISSNPPASVPAHASYTDPKDKFWVLYLEHARVTNEQRLDRWKGDTDGILVFMGLFAATIATFLSATYTSLSSDSGDQTVLLLSQLVALANNSATLGLPALVSAEAPPVPISVISFHALWFMSLCISIVCSLLAIMVQQWARQYNHRIQRGGAPSIRGPESLLLSKGVDKFRTDDIIEFIITLVHIAVLLFFIGLIIFLSTVNTTISRASGVTIGLGALLYVVLSILSLLYPECPYYTPLTPACRHLLYALLSVLNTPVITLVRPLWKSTLEVLRNATHTIKRAVSTPPRPRAEAIYAVLLVCLIVRDALAILGRWYFDSLVDSSARMRRAFHRSKGLGLWIYKHHDTLKKDRMTLLKERTSYSLATDAWTEAIEFILQNADLDTRDLTTFFNVVGPLVFSFDTLSTGPADSESSIDKSVSSRRVLPIKEAQEMSAHILRDEYTIPRACEIIDMSLVNQLPELEADHNRGLAAASLFIRNLMTTAYAGNRTMAVEKYRPIWERIASQERDLRYMRPSTAFLFSCILESLKGISVSENGLYGHDPRKISRGVDKCVFCRLATVVRILLLWGRHEYFAGLRGTSNSSQLGLPFLQFMHAEFHESLRSSTREGDSKSNNPVPVCTGAKCSRWRESAVHCMLVALNLREDADSLWAEPPGSKQKDETFPWIIEESCKHSFASSPLLRAAFADIMKESWLDREVSNPQARRRWETLIGGHVYEWPPQ